MYTYEEYKRWIQTNDWQKAVMECLDKAMMCIKVSGAADVTHIDPDVGDNFKGFAAIDRLVELEYLVAVDPQANIGGRVYVAGPKLHRLLSYAALP